MLSRMSQNHGTEEILYGPYQQEEGLLAAMRSGGTRQSRRIGGIRPYATFVTSSLVTDASRHQLVLAVGCNGPSSTFQRNSNFRLLIIVKLWDSFMPSSTSTPLPALVASASPSTDTTSRTSTPPFRCRSLPTVANAQGSWRVGDGSFEEQSTSK